MTPELLTVEVGDHVSVDVVDVEAEFDTFDFTVDKTTFPKVKDVGKASATAIVSANIYFEIVTDESKQLKISNVKAQVVVDKLPIKVRLLPRSRRVSSLRQDSVPHNL